MADMMRSFGNSAVPAEPPGFYCWNLMEPHHRRISIRLRSTQARSGVPVKEILAKIVPGDRQRVAKAIPISILTGELYQEGYRVLHADGRTSEVIALGRCLHDEDGQPLSWAGTVRYALPDEQGNLKALCRPALAAAEEQGYRSVIDQLQVVVKVLNRWSGRDRSF